MAGDEVGDQVLLFANALGVIAEDIAKVLEVIVRWLAHLEEHIGIDVFGRDLQMTPDVMLS